jgi:PAS domain S-box-containing protein
MLRNIVEHSNELFYLHGIDHKFVYVSPQSLQILGYAPDEMMVEWTKLVTDNPTNKIGYEITEKAIRTGQREEPYLLEVMKKDGGKVLLEIEESPLKNKEGEVIGIVGAARDITERKKAEEALEETNTALKVFLKRMEEDKIELGEKILLNVKELIIPYVEKLKKSGLNEKQELYVDILKSNLNEITSSFSHTLSSRYLNLTPMEIQVANLLRQGKTNKEIGELLNSSPRTVAFHRENIRKKLGLKNKKINLKSYLLSLP